MSRPALPYLVTREGFQGRSGATHTNAAVVLEESGKFSLGPLGVSEPRNSDVPVRIVGEERTKVTKAQPGGYVTLTWGCRGSRSSWRSGRDLCRKNVPSLDFRGPCSDGTTSLRQDDLPAVTHWSPPRNGYFRPP